MATGSGAEALLQNPSLVSLTPIVEFKAGKMNWDGKLVTPDNRKGKVVLVKDHDDLHHVQWWDREKNTIIDDIVCVTDSYLEKVDKCITGRVYILKNITSDRREFYWMQEPSDEKDSDLIKKFNDAIGCDIPPKPAAPVAAASSSSSAAAPGGQMTQEQMQAQILAMFQQQLQQQQVQAGPKVSLHHILTPENLLTLLEDSEAVTELLSQMPEDQRNAEDLTETMRSAQLKQNMGLLTQAIYSDQFQLLCQMLGIDVNNTGSNDPMEALCRGLEKKHGSK